METQSKKPNTDHLYTLFTQPAHDYANMNMTIQVDPSKEEIQDHIWTREFNAYQQGVKDVLDFILANHDLLPKSPEDQKDQRLEAAGVRADQSVRNNHDAIREKLRTAKKGNYAGDWMSENVGNAYKKIQSIVENLKDFSNTHMNREWLINRLKQNIGYQTDIICDETNNTADVMDSHVIIARVYWKEENIIKYQELIFGNLDDVLNYQFKNLN
jgi:hypothetical protein